MRTMLTPEAIALNTAGLKAQFARYLVFDADDGRGGVRGRLLDNADWLVPLNYVEFLRDVGRHFSVNRMLTAESYRMRLETGLSFLEFNYMLLQAYDFARLFHTHACELQMGGQDQWGNIVAGIDLIRRMHGGQGYGLTFPLLMNASGEKFGKSAKGTSVWLDAERTSPYEFYQFFRNVDDADVERLLGLFTLLPMDEVRRLSAVCADGGLNRAKEILAYEATALCHGAPAAREAFLTAARTFGAADPDGRIATSSACPARAAAGAADLPTTAIPTAELAAGLRAAALFVRAGLAGSGGEAKKLVAGGGAYLNDERVDDPNQLVTDAHLKDGALVLRAGKKRYHRIVPE